MSYNSTYRKNRSKKPITAKKCRLRLTDCFNKLEKLAMTGEDKENELYVIQNATYTMIKASKELRALEKHAELEERVSQLEQNYKDDE